MKRKLILSIVALVLMVSVYAQTASDKPSIVVEDMYIMPKRGMDDKMEAAIKAHDLKYHPDGPYVAALHKVEYGEKSGWYVWIYGPTTFSAIDTRPTKENGHDADWSANVDPLIQEYGPTGLWQYNEDLSYGMDIFKKTSHYEVWGVMLKRGDYYRFKAIAEKLKKTYESSGKDCMLIFDNSVHSPNSPDVAIVWNFNNYAEWSKDSGTKAAYEKLYGPGTWQNMITEWLDITKDYSSELRSIVK